jgi:hypothetical protein
VTAVLAKARAAWGDPLPDWIERLAQECQSSSQRLVGERLGRSAGLISQVLANKYPGNLAAIEEAVRGAYLAASVNCPALGQLPVDECQSWRRKARKFVNVNSQRVAMYRACSSCPRNQKDA